jgi:hypothetical protein
MIRVLADLHHGVLWEGLAMLCDRLDWELVAWQDGHYVRTPTHHADFPPRRVTVVTTDQVLRLPPEIVLATTGINRQRMRALAGEIGALYVDHVGNPWDQPISEVVLRSMELPANKGIAYHPEFHRLPWEPPAGKRVGVFHTSFATLPCREDWDRHATADWLMYGAEVPLMPFQVAAARQACVGTWVCKDTDGYGFAVHEAFASGRVIIGHAAHYAGKFAEPLFERGVTYLEPGDDIEVALADPVPWGLRARERFESLVDFEAEAAAVATYLSAALAVPAAAA